MIVAMCKPPVIELLPSANIVLITITINGLSGVCVSCSGFHFSCLRPESGL